MFNNMDLKILTINVWRYYEWERRKEKLINFLKNQDADIIFLQEVAYDERLKNKWKNQIEEINEKLNYHYYAFEKLMEMTKWHEKPIDWVMYYGFGILSKFPIIKQEVIILPYIKKKKNFGFMHTIIKTARGNLDLINVHLENTDKGSKEHIKKILEWCEAKNIYPIIAGDFNIKIVENLLGLSETDYDISYKIKPYKSFMPTNFSNNKKPITLDYIIAHKKKFKIKKVDCINNDVSDHNPVFAEIKVL